MFARIARLSIAARLLAFRISLLGLKVELRERAYHALTRYNLRTGFMLCAKDDDDDVDAKIAAAVEDAVAPLKAKNKELQGELRQAKAKGKDLDPADLERLEQRVEELTTQLNDANKLLKTATTKAETAEKALATEQAAAHRLLIDNGLAAALAEAGVTDPVYAKGAAALIRDSMKLEVVADGDKRVVKVGDKLLGDVVKEWGQGPEGKAYATAPGNSGGDARGGDGKQSAANPFAKDTFDLTAQGKLYTENPTQAKALAAAAGVTLE